MAEQDLFSKDFLKEVQTVLNLSDIELNQLITEAAQANYIFDKRMFESRGIPFIPFDQNYFMQSLTRGIIDNTQNTLVNITRSLGFLTRTPQGLVTTPLAQFYRQELDFAVTKVASGVQTFDQAVRQAVVKMADSGVRTAEYATGHTDRIDVAARRAVMGAMRDLTNLQSEYNADIMGVTTYEISWHGGHRPSHAWGGRRFDTEGIIYPTEEELYKAYKSPEGVVGTLEDYNCYHEKYAVFPDAPSAYPDSELNRLEDEEKKEKSFESKRYDAYEARQQQRYLERCIRRQKSIQAGLEGAKAGGADVDKDLMNAQIKMRMLRDKYKNFSEAMGLRTEPERINTGFTV